MAKRGGSFYSFKFVLNLKGREMETEDLLSSGSLPKMPKTARAGQAEAWVSQGVAET